ncbi:MAG TPA: anthranilate synthase component I family protein [Polyangiaceae bacterium]|jgi:anthranilate/para-aminobenzoate synthase component I
MLESRPVDAPSDAFTLAERLRERQDVSLWWARGGALAYLACDPIAERDTLDPEPELRLDAQLAPDACAPRWVGILPYEARRELERRGRGASREKPQIDRVRWLRYGAVAEIGSRVRVLGDQPERIAALVGLLERPSTRERRAARLTLERVEPPALHAARIRAALEEIRAGNLYQVNLARRFDFRVEGRPWELLAKLSRTSRPAFAAALAWGELSVMAASPELFLHLDTSRQIVTSPIKGTRPRGASAELDAQLRAELAEDPKERAELTMILDVERNDLGRVCKPGSVRLLEPPHVETHATVHHRLASLGGELYDHVNRRTLLEVMLPSGSVTGAPKVSAMDLIAELEAERRGLYTGAFGTLSHDGRLTLGMAIRTLTVLDGQGHYFAGGGIVADSDPSREVEETLWKAQALLELVG